MLFRSVNGIPQLELFNAKGDNVGRSVGARTAPELQALGQALLADAPMPALAGVGKVSQLEQDPLQSSPSASLNSSQAGPRSHG